MDYAKIEKDRRKKYVAEIMGFKEDIGEFGYRFKFHFKISAKRNNIADDFYADRFTGQNFKFNWGNLPELLRAVFGKKYKEKIKKKSDLKKIIGRVCLVTTECPLGNYYKKITKIEAFKEAKESKNRQIRFGFDFVKK